jgi:hypothetical protein
MAMAGQVHRLGLVLAALVAGTAAAMAAAPPGETPTPGVRARTDLADMVAGSYFGAVVSDARGSSQSDVRITVTRIGPNRVRIAADYPRLPAFEARLTRAMDTIQNADGDEVFLLDLAQNPHSLHVTVDDASWHGARE